jgi:hypothetical protein
MRSNSVLLQTADAPAVTSAVLPASCDDTAMIGSQEIWRDMREQTPPLTIIEIVVGENQIEVLDAIALRATARLETMVTRCAERNSRVTCCAKTA